MSSRSILSVAAAAMLALPLPVQAQGDVDRTALERIDATVRDFDRRGLPSDLLRAKIAEGTAKGASQGRIADAVVLLAARVDSVARLLAPSVSVPELHAGAEALSVGISAPSLRTIRTAAGRQSAEAYFQFVIRLVRRGVTHEQAVRATRSLIQRQVAASTLLAVADDLARDVADGMAPDAALNDRMTRLVGGTGSSGMAGTADGPTRGAGAGAFTGSKPP